MKRFRFPLRSVATVRSILELRAKERFSTTVQALIAAKEELAAIRRRLAAMEEVLRSHRAERFRPADEASFLENFRLETVRATRAAADVAAAQSAMEAARAAWLAARRDVRVLENLEVKARDAYRFEVAREEQAALDDRTSALVARTRTV